MKTPLIYQYTLNNTQLVRVSAEKDLGVTITGTLSWHPYIYTITTWDNKLFGLLKRTCPLLTDVPTRRAPYLSLVKSQLCYATQVWSPAQVSLKASVLLLLPLVFRIRSPSSFLSNKHFLTAWERLLTLTGPARRQLVRTCSCYKLEV